MKDLSKTWVLTGEQFEEFRRKKEYKPNSRPFRNTHWITRPLITTTYSDNICASYKIISLGPKRLLKTKNFEKEGHHSGEEKILTSFFPYYRACQTSGNSLLGSTRYFYKYFEVIRTIL